MSKKISFTLDDEVYQQVKQDADVLHLPLTEFVRLRITDDKAGAEEMSCSIGQLMPSYYRAVDQVADPHVRRELQNLGNQISSNLFPNAWRLACESKCDR